MLDMIVLATSRTMLCMRMIGYIIAVTMMTATHATLLLIHVRVSEYTLGRVTSVIHISVCNIIFMWQTHVLGYYVSDVYPGHNGMVGSVIIMLVVVYLSTNQGGVFEYDPLVSTVEFYLHGWALWLKTLYL